MPVAYKEKAPGEGIEPTTNALTARRSASELPRNSEWGRGELNSHGLGPPGFESSAAASYATSPKNVYRNRVRGI